MLTITIKVDAPACDAQGIKEHLAMQLERYGICRVVSVQVVAHAYKQMIIEESQDSIQK